MHRSIAFIVTVGTVLGLVLFVGTEMTRLRAEAAAGGFGPTTTGVTWPETPVSDRPVAAGSPTLASEHSDVARGTDRMGMLNPAFLDARQRFLQLAHSAAETLPQEELNRLNSEVASRVGEVTATRRLNEAQATLEKIVAEFPATDAAKAAGRMLRAKTLPAAPVEAPREGAAYPGA